MDLAVTARTPVAARGAAARPLAGRSAAAASTSGTALPVDGGWTAH